VELLKSRDLLAQVAVATGLQNRNEISIGERLKRVISKHSTQADPQRAIASAAAGIGRQLQVQPLRKSAIIEVTYASEDPKLAADVLTSLSDHYLDKHLAVHRPSGAFAFFEQETERYGKELALVQARLNEQNRKEAVISVQVQRENALRRVGELEAAEQTTQAQVAETAARIRVLEAQLASTPVRAEAQIRRGSPVLLEQLHSTLATYELKRIELQRIFQPDYPLVQEVETQIVKLQGEIAAAEASPLVEETTDRNPTYDYLTTELAKSRSELAGLQARVNVTARSLAADRERAWQLEQVTLTQQGLVRAATQAEQNQLIYSRKREEARISNALDAQRILNVAIAEKATVPFEPSGPSRAVLLLFGALFAALVSVGLACLADYLDPSFRTPDEVEAFLGLPVLASIPRSHTAAELIS
jgi:polysaccharide biosynthesis protein PslE